MQIKLRTLTIWASCAPIFATYLRYYSPGALRQWLTHVLGYDARACVEHFLVAASAPLTLALLGILSAWLFDHLRHLCLPRRFGLPPTFGLATESYGFGIFATGVAMAYAVLSFSHEYRQAWDSVYGGPPRGYIQWEQVAADTLGALLAIAIARSAMKTVRLNGTTHTP